MWMTRERTAGGRPPAVRLFGAALSGSVAQGAAHVCRKIGPFPHGGARAWPVGLGRTPSCIEHEPAKALECLQAARASVRLAVFGGLSRRPRPALAAVATAVGKGFRLTRWARPAHLVAVLCIARAYDGSRRDLRRHTAKRAPSHAACRCIPGIARRRISGGSGCASGAFPP